MPKCKVNDGCCPGDAAPSAPPRQPPNDQDDNSRERGYERSQRQNGRSRPNGRGTRSYSRQTATDQYRGIAERAEKRLVVKPPIAVPVTGACGKGESDDREAFPTEGAGGGGGGGGVGENGVEDPEICKLRAGTRPKKEVLRKMCTALAIATAFMVFQFVGGYVTGSIAIMTDAVHELSDAFNYVIAIAATILSVRAAKRNYSFGYHRAETIGALINVVSICVLAGMLVMQAVERLIEPEPVEGRLMFIFACTGLAVNLALLFTIGSHCPQCQNNGGGCGDVGMSLMPGGGGGCDDKGCEDKACEDDPVAKVLADAHCIKDGGKSNSSSGSPRNGSRLPRISATPASPQSDRSRDYIGNFRINAYGDAVDNANAVLAAAASHAGSEFSQHHPNRHQRDYDQHSVVSDYQSVSLLGPASTIYSEASRRGRAGAPAPPMVLPERVSRVAQYTERRADRYGDGYAALTRSLHKVTDGLRSPTQSSRTNQDNLRKRSNTLARHGAATEAISGVHATTVGSSQRPATRQSRTRSSNAHTGRSRGRGVGEGIATIDIESMSNYSEDYMSSSGNLDVVVVCPELQVPSIQEAVNRVPYTKRTQVRLVASAVAEGWTAASRMRTGISHSGGGYYAEEGEQTVHGGMESRYAPKIELQGSDNGVQIQQAAPVAYVSAPASTNGPARAPGSPQITPDSKHVAASAPSYKPAPPAAPVSASSRNSGRLPAQAMQPARAEANHNYPSTNSSASSSIRKHVGTERDAQPIEHPPPQSYSAVSANTTDGVVAHVSMNSSMPHAPQSIQVAAESPHTNEDMLHVGSGDSGSSYTVQQAQMRAPSESGEESGAGACCKATPSTASRTADVPAPQASENFAQDVAQRVSNQEPPKQHRFESMKKPHSSVSAISEDSAASEQQNHAHEQSAPASSVPSQLTAREPEIYEDSVMSKYGGELDDVDAEMMGVPVAESSAQPTRIIQTYEVNHMRGSKGGGCCKSDRPPPRATAEHLARYGPSTGTRSDYEGAGSLPSMDSSNAHRNVMHARDGSQLQSHRIYSQKKSDKVDYAAHVQDLLKLTESELSDEYSDNPSRNSSKGASRKQKKECAKRTGCKEKGCDDPAPGGDDNDDAASSDDGMYIGNGGKNSSLRGIELHLIADVLQQVGLTIAGSILWWKDNDPDWLWVDPCCTFFFGFLVILMTKDLLITSVRDLMEATPPRIDLDVLTRKLEKIKDVVGLHDLHVWAISNDKVLMTAHIKVLPQSDRTTVNAAAERVAQRFGITHCTVQQVVVE